MVAAATTSPLPPLLPLAPLPTTQRTVALG